MGVMTNQWIKDQPKKRNRRIIPIQGRIQANSLKETSWSEKYGVVFRISLHCESTGQYQAIFFTQQEIDNLLPKIDKSAVQLERLNIAQNTLRQVSDEELLSFLATLFSARSAKQTKQTGAIPTPKVLP